METGEITRQAKQSLTIFKKKNNFMNVSVERID